MYVSQQMLRVHHDEWVRYAEMRRQVGQAKAERRPAAARLVGRRRRRRALRPGRPVSDA
jgi:hypothetical protein